MQWNDAYTAGPPRDETKASAKMAAEMRTAPNAGSAARIVRSSTPGALRPSRAGMLKAKQCRFVKVARAGEALVFAIVSQERLISQRAVSLTRVSRIRPARHRSVR